MNNVSILLGSLALAGLASGAYLLKASGASKSDADDFPDTKSSDKPVLQPVGDKLPILTGHYLLQQGNRPALIQSIHEKLGFSDTAFQNDVLPLLEQFAFYIQQTPASEAHHHAHPGGLIDHCLEVASISLRLSSAMNLPPNVATEDKKRLAPVWKYGVLVAALLHDLGKTITGMLIDVYVDPTLSDGVRWQPEFGAMDMNGRYKYYRTAFRDVKPDYTLHAQLAWSLFAMVVPMRSRTWINESDPKLFDSLREYLTGNKSEPFHQLVMEADMESTAGNLRHGSRVRFATAKQKPWIELFMESLRSMLAEKGGYFSIAKDAGGEVFRSGGHVYIMSKTLADTLRKYVHDAKLANLPSENHRIFDTFQEYGAIELNPFQPNKSIWDIEVTMNTATETGKKSVFTVLCFKANKLFGENQELWPAEYQGLIQVINRDSHVAAPQKSEVEANNQENDVATKDAIAASLYEEKAALNEAPPVANDNQLTVESTTPATTNEIVGATNTNELAVDSTNKPTIQATQATSPVTSLPAPDESSEAGELESVSILELLSQTIEGVGGQDYASVGKSMPKPPTSKKTKQSNNYDFDAASKRLADLKKGKTAGAGLLKTDAKPAANEAATAPAPKPANETTKNEIVAATSESKSPTALETRHVDEPTHTSVVPASDAQFLPIDASISADDLKNDVSSIPKQLGRPVDMSPPTLQGFVTEQAMQAAQANTLQASDEQQTTTPAKKITSNPTPASSDKPTLNRELVGQFLNWLKDSLASGALEVNTSASMVHRVEQGLLLLSPKIFSEFTGDAVYRFSKESPARQAQRALESSDIIHKTKRTAQFKAEVTAISGKRTNFMTVYLIPHKNMYVLFSTPPEINPHIKFIEDEQFRTK